MQKKFKPGDVVIGIGPRRSQQWFLKAGESMTVHESDFSVFSGRGYIYDAAYLREHHTSGRGKVGWASECIPASSVAKILWAKEIANSKDSKVEE